jgi:hypothetical protein
MTVLQVAPIVQVHRALIPNTDYGNVDPVVRAFYGRVRFGAKAHRSNGDSRRARHAALDEVSSIGRVHV